MSATGPADIKLSANIIAEPTCSKCRHSFGDTGDLVCRRYPPQQTIVMVPQQGPARLGPRGPEQQVGFSPQPFSSFPICRPDQVCGEFSLKPSKLS